MEGGTKIKLKEKFKSIRLDEDTAQLTIDYVQLRVAIRPGKDPEVMEKEAKQTSMSVRKEVTATSDVARFAQQLIEKHAFLKSH